MCLYLCKQFERKVVASNDSRHCDSCVLLFPLAPGGSDVTRSTCRILCPLTKRHLHAASRWARWCVSCKVRDSWRTAEQIERLWNRINAMLDYLHNGFPLRMYAVSKLSWNIMRKRTYGTNATEDKSRRDSLRCYNHSSLFTSYLDTSLNPLDKQPEMGYPSWVYTY